VLDLAGPYRKTFEDSLDHLTQVAKVMNGMEVFC
jgi:hypothetical protein